VHPDEDVLERPTPSSTIACGGLPAISVPSNVIDPEVGW
jgi:hypothetical protein